MHTYRWLYPVFFVVLIVVGCGSTPGPGGGGGDADATHGTGEEPGPALTDTIAYVPTDGRDAIRVVAPDGSGDRELWAHGRADPESVAELRDLAWSPDGREIAFTGSHEFDCSIHSTDVYAVGTNGAAYRRLSGPPDCAGLDAYGSATVRVPVRNDTLDSVDIFLYFLGASGAEQVSLPPGGTSTITFDDVADLGDGVDQYAMMIQPGGRYLAASTALDVQAGAVHTTAEQPVWTNGSPGWEARAPSWHRDGKLLAYVYGFDTIYGQAATPEPLSLGDELTEPGGTVTHVAWNPAEEWQTELLYVGRKAFENTSIFLLGTGQSDPAQPVVTVDSTEFFYGLAWLPDGNGFVYSVSEDFGATSNLWTYSLVTDAATPVTSFDGELAGALSVSADGQEIVFARAEEAATLGYSLTDPDVWIVGLDGNGLRLLVEGGDHPAWSGD